MLRKYSTASVFVVAAVGVALGAVPGASAAAMSYSGTYYEIVMLHALNLVWVVTENCRNMTTAQLLYLNVCSVQLC